MDTVQKTAAGSQQRILEFDLASELHHGMLVSNLAYAVAEEMGSDGARWDLRSSLRLLSVLLPRLPGIYA